ncbi:unnamed protein product [Moneuplotes crassus]|uniref:Uncharacterized protein n=1 Tax=Euplotes crassus TaxID=5936 RepID=A0AAD1U2Q9_EUPCR|nr:unnamed protein product [Moneuplotes crassus]
MSKLFVNGFDETKEMENLYNMPDDNESEKIFSTIEIDEYWENLREEAIHETNVHIQISKPLAKEEPTESDRIVNYLKHKQYPQCLRAEAKQKDQEVLGSTSYSRKINDLKLKLFDMEKKYQEEVRARRDLQADIKQLKIMVHKEHLQSVYKKVSEEAQAQNHMKLKILKERYDQEFNVVHKNYHELYFDYMNNTELNHKMSLMSLEQEQVLIQMRLRTQMSQNKQGINKISTEKPKIMKKDSLHIKYQDSQAELNQLHSEIDILRNQYTEILKKWENSETIIKEMKGEIAKLKEEHTHNTQLLNIKYEIKEKCLKDKIQQLVTKLSQTSKDFKNELKLNDEIINRYCKHNDNLKKQVVLCKNVIKNPKMMAHSIRKYNFDELQVYQYGEIKKSQSRKDWRKSFDRELKSITDSELTSYENFVANDKERAKTRDISQRKNRKQLKNIITKIARSNSGSKSSLGYFHCVKV